MQNNNGGGGPKATSEEVLAPTAAPNNTKTLNLAKELSPCPSNQKFQDSTAAHVEESSRVLLR